MKTKYQINEKYIMKKIEMILHRNEKRKINFQNYSDTMLS